MVFVAINWTIKMMFRLLFICKKAIKAKWKKLNPKLFGLHENSQSNHTRDYKLMFCCYMHDETNLLCKNLQPKIIYFVIFPIWFYRQREITIESNNKPAHFVLLCINLSQMIPKIIPYVKKLSLIHFQFIYQTQWGVRVT